MKFSRSIYFYAKYDWLILWNNQPILDFLAHYHPSLNVISKTSVEYPATQNMQHTIVYRWLELVIKYLSITHFV